MRRFLPFVALLLLTACKSSTLSYDLIIDTDNETYRSALVPAAMRVIERRFHYYGEEVKDLEIGSGPTDPRIIVTASIPEVLDILTADLIVPFELRFMKQAPPDEPEVIVVEGQGAFMETGINEDHLEWFEAVPDENPEQGRMTITFTEEGRELMGEVFKENVGKNIGLFLRNRLMFTLLVDTDELKDAIVITEIPELKLAQTFADDVNVGLHVIFVPVK